jgi:decaprenylphospho-beta-D-erythro-pentofuranosid-2-ulose 2-reductase
MRDALTPFSTVLVLGGRSEIAAATVRLLRQRGARTVVHGMREPSDGDPQPAVPFDAATASKESIDAIFDAHGDIDLVLLAFGSLGAAGVAQVEPANIDEVMTVNATAAMRALSLVVERLRAQGHGTVVVFSSVAAVRPRASNFVYGASKAALDAFARGLRLTLVDSGVRVLVVRPGFVHTKMTRGLKAAPFSVSADDAAAAIVAGLDGERDVVYVPRLLRLVALALRALPERVMRAS